MIAAHLDAAANGTALKRVGETEEIAGLVAYLAGNESGFMTGESITIDGGYVL
jgi:3-oxoacyl-[acyl-carrier protein] reductase